MQTSAGNAWLLGAGLALGFGSLAHAAPGCRSDAIAGRFVEAARLCAKDTSPAPIARDNVTRNSRTRSEGAAAFADRSAVSVTMPSRSARRGGPVRTGYTPRAGLAARGSIPRVQPGVAQHAGLIVAVAQRYRINPRLLASMMRTESSGNPRAISSKGALGLMQVMPGTARSLGITQPRAMLTNPALAMSAGAAYLKRLQHQLGNDVPLVVAAYNAGPGAVMRAKRRIPRYRETQGYVRNVMGGFARTRK
jgi:soluble lytic murein transglycosylase-like protein